MPIPLLRASILSAAAVLAGCAAPGNPPETLPYQASTYPDAAAMYGTIESISVTRAPAATSGAGAAVGGLVGGLVGNQVGSGTGRTAATAAGALAGAVVGNQMEAQRAAARDQYAITVRLDNGERRTIVQDSAPDLGVGNRVRIIDGRVYRY